MKRSEFIDKLHDRCEKELYMMDIGEKEALSILISFIEEAGMLPPLSKSKEKELWDDIRKHNDANPVLYANCMDYYFDWEPEDEG